MMWVCCLWFQVSVERFGDVEYGGFGTPWEFVYKHTECGSFSIYICRG